MLRANCFSSQLGSSNVLSLKAFGTFDYVQLNCLAFLQTAKAVLLDGREVYENIIARLAANEAVSLGVVKPFHCSLFHCDTCFYVEFLLRRIAAGETGDR